MGNKPRNTDTQTITYQLIRIFRKGKQQQQQQQWQSAAQNSPIAVDRWIDGAVALSVVGDILTEYICYFIDKLEIECGMSIERK